MRGRKQQFPVSSEKEEDGFIANWGCILLLNGAVKIPPKTLPEKLGRRLYFRAHKYSQKCIKKKFNEPFHPQNSF